MVRALPIQTRRKASQNSTRHTKREFQYLRSCSVFPRFPFSERTKIHTLTPIFVCQPTKRHRGPWNKFHDNGVHPTVGTCSATAYRLQCPLWRLVRPGPLPRVPAADGQQDEKRVGRIYIVSFVSSKSISYFFFFYFFFFVKNAQKS